MKKVLAPTLAVIAVAGIAILAVQIATNRPSVSTSPSTDGVGTVQGDSPSSGEARTEAKRFDEAVREAERKKAALLRAQQIAAEKVLLVQFRDRLEGVRKLLDDRKAEDERWNREVEPLLDNDDGKAVVAARFTQDVLLLRDQRKGYELSEEATRNCIELLIQPVKVALDDGQALFSPDSSAVGQVALLEGKTREPTRQNRDTREAIRRLVQDARSNQVRGRESGTGATLRAAMDRLRTDEDRRRCVIVHAQVAKRQTAAAEQWAARKLKLIDRLGPAKAEEVEAAFRAATDKEKYEQPKPAHVAARQTLRDNFGKPEADEIETAWFYCWRWTLAGAEPDRQPAKAR